MPAISFPASFARWAEAAALAVAYVVTARVGQSMAIPPGNVTSVWIPSGLVMAVLIARGRDLWPGVFAGAVLGNMWAYVDSDAGGSVAPALFAGLLNGTGDALGSYLGALLVTRGSDGRSPFERASSVLTFLAAGVGLSSAISAALGVTALGVAGILPWSRYGYTLATWFFGDAVGVLLVTPAILGWVYPRARLDAESGVFLAVLAAVAAHCLGLLPLGLPFTLPLFALTPLFMWAVFRLTAGVTFPAILGVAVLSILTTAAGSGPFASGALPDALLALQLFLATMAITVLVFHAISAERKSTLAALEALNAALETRVAERSAALTAELTARVAAEAAQVHLERQVLHAQKLESLGVLAGGVAHDYNNVLTVILANAELALMEMPAADPTRAHLEQVIQAAHRSAALTRQMLAYSGHGAFKLRDVDLGAHVRELHEMLSVAVGRRITIALSVAEGTPLVHADPSQVDQLVMNLVINAGEAMASEDGTVRVSVSTQELTRDDLADAIYASPDQAEGTYVRLRVQDTGCGMDSRTLERIFDPFFTSKAGGRGLGMAVVLGIVRGHHGAIRVRSEPGVGTSFDVLLPVAAADATPAAPRR